MVKETDIQSKIVNEAEKGGAKAYKTAHSFFNGLPDLDIKYPDLELLHLEVKYEVGDTKTKRVVGITKNQGTWIRDHHRVNACAGWVVVVELPGLIKGRKQYRFHFGIDTDPDPLYGPTTNTVYMEGEMNALMVRRLVDNLVMKCKIQQERLK